MSDSFADNILDDDSLAPLKRNHACLQCKKRKVKCDAIKPVCSPCLRSHAHALRSAHRNNVAPPRCSCTYADTDTPPPSDDESPTTSHVQQAPRSDSHDSGATKKKGGQDAIKRVSEKKGPKSAIGSSRNLEREKEIRRDEEKDLLLARIAELERRLAGLTPADSNSTSNLPSIGGSQYSSPAGISHRQGSGSSAAANITVDSFGSSHINRPDIQQIWVQDNNKSTTVSNDVNNDWDLGGLFMVPANWPKQLPSAFLLEHLIETFFAHAPQLPHMLHRPSLLARVRLPPTSDKFPHPSLLHAICAYAASYTAWVHTFKPEETDNQVAEYKKTHDTLDDIPDFGLSQGEAAQRSIRLATQTCIVGPGTETVEMCQASIILCDLYFGRGFPMQAWILAGTPARLVKALELGNKNRPQRFKDPMLQAPATPIQREERLATVWLTFMLDANFSINSFWNGTMELDEVWCAFPAKWNDTNGENDYIEENPQTARSAGALIEHPVISAFTLSCKASTLISRSARMLRYWNQRDPVPGDDLLLLTSTPYHQLMNDIYTFQRNIPAQLSVHKLSDGSQLNADVLLAHLMPYIALGIIHEPFMEFSNSTAPCVDILKKAVLGATALVHCIPSNLDVTSIMSASFVFSLYTLGRLTLHLRERAAQVYDMDAALQHESDVSVFCNVLRRYGQRFTLGLMMAEFLEGYSIVVRGKDLKEIDWIEREACCEVSRKKANAPLKAFKIPSRVPTPPLHNSSSTGVTPPNPNAITPPDSNLSFNQLNALGTSSLFDFDMQGIPNLPPVDLTNSTTAEVDAYVQRMTAASTKDAISAPVDTTFNANFPYPTMPPASDPMLNPYSTVDQFTYGQAPAVDCTASDVDDVNRKWAPWLM